MRITTERPLPPPTEYVLRMGWCDLHELHIAMQRQADTARWFSPIELELLNALKEYV